MEYGIHFRKIPGNDFPNSLPSRPVKGIKLTDAKSVCMTPVCRPNSSVHLLHRMKPILLQKFSLFHLKDHIRNIWRLFGYIYYTNLHLLLIIYELIIIINE